MDRWVENMLVGTDVLIIWAILILGMNLLWMESV